MALRKDPTLRRQLGILAILTVALIVAVAAYLMGRQAGQGEGAQAAPDLLPTPTEAPAQPTSNDPAESPGATPTPDDIPEIDTTEPGWDQPYREEWRAKPRYDQVINGIEVGPNVTRTGLACGPGSEQEFRLGQAEDAEGTLLEISPTYLPPGGHILDEPLDDHAFVNCNARLISSGLSVGVSAEPDALSRLEAGESWFAVRTGGIINVHKRLFAPGVTPGEAANLPAEHWYADTIAGLPAAVGRPIIDAGLGSSAVLIWDPDDSLLTTVYARDLSLEDVLKFAEGVAE